MKTRIQTPCIPRALAVAGLLLPLLLQAQTSAEPAASAASAASAAQPAASAPVLPPTTPPVPPAPPAPPPPPPPPPAFQGLPWGADEAQIAARFGARLQTAPCDAALRAAAQRRGELCESPTVPRYEVAGVPFVLTLHLDASERRLVRVTLSHGAETARGEETRWSEHHRVMRRLLAQRYGGPEFSDVQTDLGVSTAQARWRTGPALIELVSVFQPRSAAAPARESILITYQSPYHGEAAKL